MPTATQRSRPQLSVLVVVFDMEREAHRTLRSLSAAYQRADVQRLHGEARSRDKAIEEMDRAIAAYDRLIADGHREVAALDAQLAGGASR